MEKRKSKPEHMLMETLDFTPQDLRLNREGVLSERQRTLLNQTQFPSKSKLVGVILALILVGAVIGMIQVWLKYGPLSLERIRIDPGPVGGLTCVAGFFGLIGVWLGTELNNAQEHPERES